MADGNGGITVDDLLAEIRPRESSARVLLRQDLVERHRLLEVELTAAIQGDSGENRLPVAPQIAQRIVDLEAEIDAAKREFRFRAVGRRAWSDLLAQHPPGKDDRRYGMDHNPATFPPAAVAASCISPELTVDQVHRFYEAMDVAQWEALYQACLDANVGGDVGKSVAAGMTLRLSGLSAITAANGASLVASSSAES